MIPGVFAARGVDTPQSAWDPRRSAEPPRRWWPLSQFESNEIGQNGVALNNNVARKLEAKGWSDMTAEMQGCRLLTLQPTVIASSPAVCIYADEVHKVSVSLG